MLARMQDPPLALIVDHHLRRESTQEAATVAAQVSLYDTNTMYLIAPWVWACLTGASSPPCAPRPIQFLCLCTVCCQLTTTTSSSSNGPTARQAEQLGLAAHVLDVAWPGGVLPPRGDKMAAARGARYALLLAACAEAGRRRLLVAHHADDQAETFLLRLLHASGISGLACMPPAVEKQTGGWVAG